MKIAINGAGIAGPTLAWWLAEHGHEPVLIEHAPSLREGGYVVDFWGLGYDIAEKMGLIGEIRARGYQVGEVRFVDDRGRRRGGFDTDVFMRMTGGRFTSLQRSDISAVIHSAVKDRCETLFGNSIATIELQDGGVRVGFEHGAARAFDLVVGCDGLHSRVRALAFGEEPGVEKSLGYHVAAFDAAGYRPRDELVYVSHSEPGLQVSRFSLRDDRTMFLFVFHDAHLSGGTPQDDAGWRAEIRRIFGGAGWECPQILDAMDDADDLYFDRVSQIRLERWTKGRVALAGDAAACVSLLAGEGTGLAIAEAYVLAGELARAGGDFGRAFGEYERRLMPFVRRKQEGAAKFASSFAPQTATGIFIRDVATKLMRVPFVADRLIGDLRDDIELPEYGAG
jgi:2-polyprenyl-6-methoxyphenol hydroxylase-like FAD-dependent oxidoreductase